ncbi:MAG: hdhA 1 [Bradyrhizobium sp.]|jgi:3-oxoacyl-[acyl-carrier protein] reductase|nr:hdhA 1 [Bradyrhizobium sp.]
MQFAGKVAIVTGGAQGIGLGYVERLLAEGAAVAIVDIAEDKGRAAAESFASKGKVIFVRADVSDEASVKAMADTVASQLGGIDFLVNNAALFGGMRLEGMLDMELAYYNKFMSINVNGALLCTRACLSYLMQRPGAAVVNQSSTAAWMNYGIYSVAKLALNALTTSLARELGPRGIRINAIAPGPTQTEALSSTVDDQTLGMIVAQMPLPRIGTPADLANSLVFLLSDQASWMTGHILNVDGGQFMRP